MFEECHPGKNIFIVGRLAKEIRFKTYDASNVKHLMSGSEEYFNFIENCNYDVLIVHYLDGPKCKVINDLKLKKKIVWLAWGGDIYNTPFYKIPLYQPRTKKLLKEISEGRPLKTKIREGMKKVLYFFFSPTLSYKFYKKAVKKIEYCATVIPNEFEILSQWKFFNAQQVYFSYSSIEYDFKDVDLLNFNSTGNSIIIGNSMSPASNHLDVFEKLYNLKIQKRKIIVPLNYGIEVDYRDKIAESGKEIFGSSFYPLLDFVPKKSYIEILMSCNVAIMNHERQQGIGNLLLLFWLGCKIFLSEDSITYKYFKEKRFIIYSFQKDLNHLTINDGLSQYDIAKNRDLIMQVYGNKKVIEKTLQLINTLNFSA
jgi:hypothetical protein